MTQIEINESEWSNPQNWSGAKWAQLYFSRKDSRLWVPKRNRSMGWTINLGNPSGAVCLAGVVLSGIAFVVVSNVLVLNLIMKR